MERIQNDDISVTLVEPFFIVEYPEEKNTYKTSDACDVIEKHFHNELQWEQLHADETHTLHTFTPYQHLKFLIEEKRHDELSHICDLIEEKGLFHKQETLKP